MLPGHYSLLDERESRERETPERGRPSAHDPRHATVDYRRLQSPPGREPEVSGEGPAAVAGEPRAGLGPDATGQAGRSEDAGGTEAGGNTEVQDEAR